MDRHRKGAAFYLALASACLFGGGNARPAGRCRVSILGVEVAIEEVARPGWRHRLSRPPPGRCREGGHLATSRSRDAPHALTVSRSRGLPLLSLPFKVNDVVNIIIDAAATGELGDGALAPRNAWLCIPDGDLVLRSRPRPDVRSCALLSSTAFPALQARSSSPRSRRSSACARVSTAPRPSACREAARRCWRASFRPRRPPRPSIKARGRICVWHCREWNSNSELLLHIDQL